MFTILGYFHFLWKHLFPSASDKNQARFFGSEKEGGRFPIHDKKYRRYSLKLKYLLGYLNNSLLGVNITFLVVKPQSSEKAVKTLSNRHLHVYFFISSDSEISYNVKFVLMNRGSCILLTTLLHIWISFFRQKIHDVSKDYRSWTL